MNFPQGGGGYVRRKCPNSC